MNENETNNYPLENGSMPNEEKNEPITDNNTELEPESSGYIEDEEPDGFTFNMTGLVIGVAISFYMFYDAFSDMWTFIFYLFAVVIIHEMGHVILGKIFGCGIKEMQVFFLPFISYKPKQRDDSSSWRNIKWSLGALPLGGLTVFKTRQSDGVDEVYELDMDSNEEIQTPYIEDKPAWQRLLISAAGVLFNLATFLIFYFALPHMSMAAQHFWGPLIYLSLILAILNILPIYPLDGGVVLFALYEIITGRKPSPEFTRICSWIGFAIIILFFWVFPEWMSGFIERILGMFF